MMMLAKLKGLAVALAVGLVGVAVVAGVLPAVADDTPNAPRVGPRPALVALQPEKAKPAGPPAPKVIDYDGPVDTVALSPDGKLVAAQARIDSGEGDTPARYKEHTVKLWDAKTGKEVRTLLKEGRSSGVAFAPDGKSVAAIVTKIEGKTTENEVRIWGVNDKTEASLFGSKAVWLYELAFSPDGKTIAAGGVLCDETGRPNGGAVTVWEVATGNVLWQNYDHKDAVRRLAFSPDGKKLATPSDDKTVRIWDAATGKHLKTIDSPQEHWYSAAFRRDGKLLATGGSDGAWVWDAETGGLKHTLKAYKTGSILIVQFLADGTLVTGGTPEKGDGNLKFWDMKTGTQVKALPEPNQTFRAMDISRDGKTIAVGTWDKTLVILPVPGK